MSASRGAPRHLVGAGLITEAGECLELRWELDPGEADGSTLDLHCGPAGEFTRIGLDHRRGRVWLDGGGEQHWAGARGALVLRVIVSPASVDVASGDGQVVLGARLDPVAAGQGVAVLKQGSGDWVRSVLTVWPLA
ncbi:hypothetical protein [Roseateles saccharophilus]|uniref:Uncharacterized protein n=1 Tax=Roseateles saccharophilus TaxID=304 RepID=A0A4R3VCM3_ROSSA|nr:hypothetical protein [Roseateles saccharophilus]MDG0835018.1 hypothetical protein [Roseateles saccharophilus]TCV00395.1 hypothetical protein EV671_1008150 [Roseateles saccharophilus]